MARTHEQNIIFAADMALMNIKAFNKFTPWESRFIASLITTYEKRGVLSVKQKNRLYEILKAHNIPIR